MFADCYHPVINGVVTSIDILKNKLDSLGHDVELFVPAKSGYEDKDLSVHRFFSVTVPIHKESRFSVFNPWRHISRLRKLEPEVVHIHTPFNLGGLGVWSSQKLRIPYVFTHHTLWEEYVHYVPLVSQRLLRRTAIGICRYFCNRSGGVVAPSDEVKARLLEQGVTQRIDVIPTGIDVELFEQGDPERVRRELGVQPDEPLAIFAGRMGKEKSIDFVLDAFKLVLEKVPRARILLLGGGPEKVNLEQHARQAGISDRVIFTGYIARNKMVDYFQASRVFLFASTTETQGLVSLEAQSAGTPVVAVRASGSNEAVRHERTGFLVEQDRQVFADAAVRVLTDDDLRCELSRRAREWAHACSSQAMADRHLELYRAAVAGAAAPAPSPA